MANEDSETEDEGQVEDLYEKIGDAEVVLRITYDEEVIEVTHKGKQFLETAMDASSNQPNHFFKCKYVIDSVCEILDMNVLEYSFPDTPNPENAEFDWNNVVAGRKETYPKEFQPGKDEFGKIRVIYNHVRTEKDDIAKSQGKPSSGIQAYKTFKIKWGAWRKWCAVYDEIFKELSKQSRLDKMTADLKLCKSQKDVDAVIDKEVMRHINRLKNAARKQREQERVQALEQELQQKQQEAAQRVAEVESQQKKIKEKKASLTNKSTRSGPTQTVGLANVKRDERAIKRTKQDAVRAQKKVERDIKELNKRKTTLDKAMADAAAPPKKPKRTAARNDLTLVNEVPTPRTIQEMDGETWKPPQRVNNTFQEPGGDWKKTNIQKVKLLISLHRHLIEAGCIEKAPSFTVLMDYLGIDCRQDGEEFTFYDRAFIYLVALYLYEQFIYDDVIACLLGILDAKIMKLPQMAGASEDVLAAAIKGDNDFEMGTIASNLHEISMSLNSQAVFPTSYQGLVDCGVGEEIAQKLTQQVFGSTELVIGLNIRKVAVAIDLIDWEALEDVERRSDVKMKNLTAAHVKSSIKTWLPAGSGFEFQEAIECVGEAIGENKVGFWGKLKSVINKHFTPAEKDKLNAMCDAILRYYKASKCGARKKFRF